LRQPHPKNKLFLPEGTRLRACFSVHSYFAQVEGDAIKYGEHAMSPSRFANLQGSGNRNAWKAISGALRSAVQPAARRTASAPVTCASPHCATAASAQAVRAKASQAHLARRLP